MSTLRAIFVPSTTFCCSRLVLFSARRAWRPLGSAPGASDFTLLRQYWGELRGIFRGLLWCLSTLPLILLLGYPLGLGAFAALLARGHGRGWRASLAAGVCTCADRKSVV